MSSFAFSRENTGINPLAPQPKKKRARFMSSSRSELPEIQELEVEKGESKELIL